MLSFIRRFRQAADGPEGLGLQGLLAGYSIEVMPRTAAKVESFRALLPAGTRVYIAHIDGTATDDMVATARRLTDEGFTAMPHIPARLLDGRDALDTLLARYREEAGVREALLLGGGATAPRGGLTSSINMLQTGLFDRHGFTRLHVAGHPEGNRDIDPGGGTAQVDAALAWKQGFSEQTDAEMAIVTQFAFEAAPVLAWIGRLRAMGITLPVHAGIAGPAKLQTMIRFAVACGVGPSMKVLQKRARDVTRLVLPYEPGEVLGEFAEARARQGRAVAQFHFFPLGGIVPCADWIAAADRTAR